MGLCSIAFSSLETIMILVCEVNEFPNGQLWCTLNLKISSSFYVLHRVFLYGFVVLRIEVIMDNRRRGKLKVVKWFLILYSLSLTCAVLVFTNGNYEGHHTCNLNSDQTALVMLMFIGFIIDIIICVSSTCVFLRQLWPVLKFDEDSVLRYIAKKELWCVGTSLLSTTLTLIGLALLEDVSGILIGIDGAITTISLVILLSPPVRNKRNRLSDTRLVTEEPLLLNDPVKHIMEEDIMTNLDILAFALRERRTVCIDGTRPSRLGYLQRDSSGFSKYSSASSERRTV